MICLAVTYIIRAGAAAQAIERFRALTDATRREPGCAMYIVHQSTTDSHRFFLYEQYHDLAALDAHRASPHFEQYATNGLYLIAESRSVELYTPL
jgi:quinol monooxygenase YgiN